MGVDMRMVRTRAVMRRVGLSLVAILLSACTPDGQDSIPPYEFEQYSMFSWKTDSNSFCFAVMIQAKSHAFLRSWSKKKQAKCGMSELQKALAALPRNSVVLWQDWPPANLDYPPDDVVQQVIEFAKANGIELKQSPSLR